MGLQGGLSWIVRAALAVLPLSLALAKPQPQRVGDAAYAPVSRDPALYAGSDACQPCHFDLHESFAVDPHHATTLDARRGIAWQGCESCHGPGRQHAETADPALMFSFAGAPSYEVAQRCLECHQFAVEHGDFARSAHALGDVGCLSCHTIHQPAVREPLLTAGEPQLCYSCHLEVRSEFDRPFRHRVNEGLIGCSDCHNPHDGLQARQLSPAARDEGCVQCHTETRGPFVFEHAPVKTEGCTSCHSPHGSSNPRMLTRSNVNLLCLDCHSASHTAVAPVPVGPAHNQMQRFQACTLCHSAVHGSNSSSGLFQ